MDISKTLKSRKIELLTYFRNRAEEFLSEIKLMYGNAQYNKQTSAINTSLIGTKEKLIAVLLQKASAEEWTNEEKLESILMITYASYIVMLETRNGVWPYDYMAFSRRIGELWESFCKQPFSYPIKDVSLFIPPLFSDVRQKLSTEIEVYIDKLKISSDEKIQLKKYYNKVWGLVTSGEIKLELDLHFMLDGQKYVVDFKSGFGSNEKGNLNRLLLVASIYKSLEENYKCVILVRAIDNNHYFQTLKKSGIWSAYCGNETYDKIKEYSGVDIKKWIVTNIDWESDFKPEMIRYLKDNNLTQYLVWQ